MSDLNLTAPPADSASPPFDAATRHRIVAAALCGSGAIIASVIYLMIKLNSEAIALNLIALTVPSTVAIVLGSAGLKTYENVKVAGMK